MSLVVRRGSTVYPEVLFQPDLNTSFPLLEPTLLLSLDRSLVVPPRLTSFPSLPPTFLVLACPYASPLSVLRFSLSFSRPTPVGAC